MSGVKKRLPRESYHCEMCHKYIFNKYKYIYETFEILPKTPKEELSICGACAKREMKLKKRDKLNDYWEEYERHNKKNRE